MKYLASVSTIAVAIGSGIAPVTAQVANTTPANVNVLNLLGPFLTLNGTTVGQQSLQLNLTQAIAINNNATLAQQQLAISDKALPGSTPFLGSIRLANGTVINLGPGDNLAGGLPPQAVQSNPGQPGTVTPYQPVGGYGPLLGPIYQTGIRSSTATSGPLAATFALLNNAYNFTSSDLGVSKNYFANGAPSNPSTTPAGYVPVPAVAPPGYTLPTAPYTIPAGSPAGPAGSTGRLPNRFDSVLDLAYGVRNTTPGQDVYGSSRPVQVAPTRINVFDPTALNGLATNPSFPSGHTNYAYTDGILLGMLTPQLYQSILVRASEYSDSRIVLGVHYPLDIIASRAFASYDLAQAFTNPAYINNAATTGTPINLPSLFNASRTELAGYLGNQCGSTAAACATSPANTTNNPYVPSPANQALYASRLTYGLPTLTFAQAPREAAPAGGPDASILLAPIYGGSTTAAATIAPNGGINGQLQTSTINQIVVNTETNALAAFSGTPLSYWSRINLYDAVGYFGNVTGRLTMDPADRLNTDATVGSDGTLFANGTIAGLATVNSGGVLGGTGRVGSLLVNGGGVLAPGASIGTLTVTGNATFAPGSIYQVEVNAAGQSDRTVVGGTAFLQGGTVQVLAGTGAYNPRTTYNILTAGTGVAGRFAGVTSNLAFLNPYLTYDPNNVNLTLVRNDIPFAAVATSPNQAATATGVQSLGFGNRVYDAVSLLSAPQAQQAFNLLSGEVYASEVSTQYETGFMIREAILDHLRGGFGAVGGLPGVPAGTTLPSTFSADLPGRPAIAPFRVGPVLDPRVFSFWGQGFGSFGSTTGNGNAATLTRDTGGFVVGGDATIDGIYRIGIAGGYTDTTLDVRSRLSSGEVTSGFGAIYGAANFGNVTARIGGVFAGNSFEARRNVLFPGFSDSLRGQGDGTTIQGFGELGYRFGFGSGVIEPIIGGAGMVISRDGFTEQGGAAALRVLGRDYTIETVTAGIRGEFALGGPLPISFRTLLAYRGSFGDVVPAALLAFATGSSQFSVAGVPIDRHALVAEAGLDWKVTRDVSLGVSYAGQIGDRARDNGVRGNFLWKF